MVWRREPVVYDGQTVHDPAARRPGHRARQAAEDDQPPEAADIPIFWASLMGKSVDRHGAPRRRLAADLLRPDEVPAGVGRRPRRRAWPTATRRSGRCRSRPAAWSPSATSTPATAPTAVLDMARPSYALYVGGMGARDKNFYNTIAKKYGYVDEATEIQDLYLSGRKEEAAAKVPRELLAGTQPRRPRVARRRAHRRLQGGRRHAPVGQPRRRPTRSRPSRRCAPSSTDGRAASEFDSDSAVARPRMPDHRTVRPCRGATTWRGPRRRRGGRGRRGPAPRQLGDDLDLLAERVAEAVLDALVGVGQLGAVAAS